jgi:hypothetical protein
MTNDGAICGSLRGLESGEGAWWRGTKLGQAVPGRPKPGWRTCQGGGDLPQATRVAPTQVAWPQPRWHAW